jgi:predicted Rossmann fold nucleotide-binding protein DprA/Smf involved in DNA uptake
MTELLRDTREVIRDEHVMRPVILAALAAGPLTVPQIAEAIGQPVREVVFWVMGMRKYGHVVDAEADEDGDLLYRAVEAPDGTEGP